MNVTNRISRWGRSSVRLVATALTAFAGLACAPGVSLAQQVELRSSLDHSILQADKKQTAYLHVALEGFNARDEAARAPLNVAIVIDKSGSMAGDKISQARAAARAAIAELGPDDIVSVVAFDDTVQVLVPATKASDRASIQQGIDKLTAGGMTALFAGVVKGGAEVRKFLTKERVNRVILVSDGQANVGPSAASALGQLGGTMRKEGISVTTVGLGLGYNEDLLVELAQRSGGQHVFVEDHRQLATIFKQGFGGLASIVAQEVTIKITLADGVRPVRVLGRDADIIGQVVTVPMAELYGGQADDLVLELDVPATSPSSKQIASIEVTYHNAKTHAADRVARTVSVEFTTDTGKADRSEVKEARAAVIERLANDASKRAVQLRDAGRIEEARALIKEGAAMLKDGAARWDSKTLEQLSVEYQNDATNLEGEQWNRQRKHMARRNYVSPMQLNESNF